MFITKMRLYVSQHIGISQSIRDPQTPVKKAQELRPFLLMPGKSALSLVSCPGHRTFPRGNNVVSRGFLSHRGNQKKRK